MGNRFFYGFYAIARANREAGDELSRLASSGAERYDDDDDDVDAMTPPDVM